MNIRVMAAAVVMTLAAGGLGMPDAGAAGCVNGAYRAGCAGPNGAVGVRKAPVYRAPVYRTPAYRPPVYRAPVYPPRPVVVAPPPRPPVVVVPPPRPVVVVPPPPRPVVVVPAS